jgi:tetratricopeptide (TPR) repeat protein
LDLAIQLKNPVLQAIITGNLGNVFLGQNEYYEATRYYSRALKVFHEQRDDDGEARMLSCLGSVNLSICNYELALEYYQKSLEIYQKITAEDECIAIILMNIGLIHFEKEIYDQAETSFENALELLQKKNDKFFITGCYSTLAKIHLAQNQLNEASLYAEKNVALNNELEIEIGILEANLIIAQLTFETNIDTAAIKGEIILANLPQNTSNELKKDVYELLYKCYKAQSKWGLSLEMHERFTTYKDSVQIEKNSFSVTRETVKNEYELRIYESKLENEKEKTKLKVSQIKKTFGIVSIAVIIINIIVFYFISSLKKSNKRRALLLEEIKNLKLSANKGLFVDSQKFELAREKIESAINRKLNETDWKVLGILLTDPVSTNKEIAGKAFMSVDGIGSSLRRMYEYFDIKDSKYKKISLLLEAIKFSNNSTTTP